MTTQKDIETVYNMTSDDLVWKPIHSNNIIGNPVMGEYCIINRQNDDGTWSGRKYSISFQWPETTPGSGIICSGDPEAYILFEYGFGGLKAPLVYPEPNERGCDCDIHEYGYFCRAYKELEHARKRALVNYKHIFGYVASHFVEDDNND